MGNQHSDLKKYVLFEIRSKFIGKPVEELQDYLSDNYHSFNVCLNHHGGDDSNHPYYHSNDLNSFNVSVVMRDCQNIITNIK